MKDIIMNTQLLADLIDSLEQENDSLEQENDSVPEGYDLESTTYTITVTLQADLARANMLEVA